MGGIFIKQNTLIDYAAAIVVFSLLLWAGCSNLWGARIKHAYPEGYLASDAFQQQVRAEYIKDAGNYNHEPPYTSQGYEDVVGSYPPVMHILGAALSMLSGLEVYDGAYLLVFLLACLSAITTYLIIREFSRQVALLSIPLSALVFSKSIYLAFAWGHWSALTALAFLLLFCWTIVRIRLKGMHIILAIALIGLTLTHTSEMIFAVLFLVLWLAADLAIRYLHMAQAKHKASHPSPMSSYLSGLIRRLGISAIIIIVASSYFLAMFYQVWMKAQPYQFGAMPTWPNNPAFYVADFGWLLGIIMVIGAIVSIVLLLSKATKPGKRAVIIIAWGMLLLGFTNYLGFRVRAFQLRFFWPYLLAPFLGIGLYIIIKTLLRRVSIIKAAVISALLLAMTLNIISIPAIGMPHYDKMTGSIMDQYHWDALVWMSKNTEEDAEIYFFYGDLYDQDAVLRNSKRNHVLLKPYDFVAAIQNRTIKRTYDTEQPGQGFYYYKISTFKFGLHPNKPEGQMDICSFGYLVFDTQPGREQSIPLIQYNLLLRQKLLEKTWIEEVFSNRVVSILKNSKPGDDCIETQTFE
ncbi:hypothetical protein COT48_02535 [Candidatus Woesearchaeota archaeon CG08_land_8_20_14_0_20_47_9]|nr:MAG: hypothetical protein AUJ69_04065 [Candidatus Woesearchaeota archaeon CG1_02_47_18]PIO04017.1 MAG: hypothetical protein COT48_02535 [Candidatus Woesearchaeota archaeon CG08_land_8_20_14_0_20_47_9]HII30136.1 hypothetical protein [Candidatus Woesearchaeota archaeon]